MAVAVGSLKDWFVENCSRNALKEWFIFGAQLIVTCCFSFYRICSLQSHTMSY